MVSTLAMVDIFNWSSSRDHNLLWENNLHIGTEVKEAQKILVNGGSCYFFIYTEIVISTHTFSNASAHKLFPCSLQQTYSKWVSLVAQWWQTHLPGRSVGKESACNAGDLHSIPGSRRSPAEGHANLLQYSCLESSMDRGA